MPIVIPDPIPEDDTEAAIAAAIPKELAAQRKITRMLIASDPTVLELIIMTTTRTNTGGLSFAEASTRDPQTFKFSQITTQSGGADPVRTIDGVERKMDFMLIGEYDAEITAGDHFYLLDEEYLVVELMAPLPYEVRALVTRYVAV